jgi:iron complex outermembrane recepter protein
MTSVDAEYFPDTQVFNVPPGTLLSQYHTMLIQDRNVATYVQATYNLTTDLHFTTGLRYDYERKATTQNAIGYAQVVSDNYTDLRASAIWEKATPKATLDYKFIPQLLGYATYSQGFLSGGFNFGPQSVLDNNPFGPEKAINYELGLKSESLGGRLLLNLAVFDVDYTDLQIGVINLTTNLPETQNVGKAISRGIEGNVAAQITDKFEADAGFAYTDAHYVRFCDGVSKAQATLTGASCVLAGGIDRNGEALEAYAKTSIRTGFHYEIVERGWGKVNLHSDGTYSSSVIYLGGYTQPSYFTLDGGLDFVAPEGRYQVGLWGRNLTDKAFVTGCAGLGSTVTGANCTMSDPRRYGISFKVRYH